MREAYSKLDGLRIAMVVTNDAASDPRVHKEAEALAGEGAAITVIAWDRARTQPTREDRKAYGIVRLGPVAPHGGGLANLGAYRRYWASAVKEILQMGPHVVHCHDTDTALVGLRSLRASGGPCALVLDLHELYRESRMIPRSGVKGILARSAVWWIESFAARRAALVVVANPGQAGCVAGVAAGDARIAIVENTPELSRFPPSDAGFRDRDQGDPLKVCYVGQKRTVDRLVGLMEAVEVTPGTSALIAGGGPAADEVSRAAEGRERIEIVGRVAYEQVARLYDGCDAVYAVYDTSVGNYRTHFPVKVMEAMAVGVPVMVSAGTWIAAYVEREGIGVAVREHDVAQITSVLGQWRDDPAACAAMGRRGRAIIDSGLNWETSAQRLVDAYASRVLPRVPLG